MLSEHHASDEGFLPSPLMPAGAPAARTTSLPITVAVVILPLYEPVRLAEEMAVLDIISRGRVMYVAGIGYRPAEYEMHGVDFHRRGRPAEEKLGVLLKAKTGEPFEYGGRRVRVTPPPATPGGPVVVWGGSSLVAARRAGRYGLGFFAQSGEVDRAWEELGPYLMHDVLSYASWNEGVTGTASLSAARTAEELRAENRSHRILSVEQAVASVRAGAPLALHPLVGGLPPETAWRYLRCMVPPHGTAL